MRGLLVRSTHARLYDLGAWLLMFGRRGKYTRRLLDLARVQPGASVLDVGCGTGTLAVAARRAGAGPVHGIDGSPDMLERAIRKARRAHVDVTFTVGTAEALPYPDASFDIVFNTLMFHHLPRPVRVQCAREMRRVLAPGGRLLLVEFGSSSVGPAGLGRLHRHGHVAPEQVDQVIREAGLTVFANGEVGLRDLHYLLARP